MSQKLSNREIIEELEVGDDRIWTLRDWKCDNCNEPETRVGKLVLACDPTGVKNIIVILVLLI